MHEIRGSKRDERENAEERRKGQLLGDGGRRRREKVKKGEEMRRRKRKRSGVELFSKCKELLVTMLRLLLASLLLRSLWLSEDEQVLDVSFHMVAFYKGLLVFNCCDLNNESKG